MADNVVQVVGNITKDPELSYTPNGAALAKFSVAVNRRWTAKDGKKDEETSFFNVVCWQDLAENVSASLVKGDRVSISGRLQQRTWETDGGDKRSVVEIVADDVAPSLRFATAAVQRTERTSGTGGQAGAQSPAGGSTEPW